VLVTFYLLVILYANKSISILNAPDALIFVLPPTTPPALNPGTPSDLKNLEPPASAVVVG
jgi:hypothetical protein